MGTEGTELRLRSLGPFKEDSFLSSALKKKREERARRERERRGRRVEEKARKAEVHITCPVALTDAPCTFRDRGLKRPSVLWVLWVSPVDHLVNTTHPGEGQQYWAQYIDIFRCVRKHVMWHCFPWPTLSECTSPLYIPIPSLFSFLPAARPAPEPWEALITTHSFPHWMSSSAFLGQSFY